MKRTILFALIVGLLGGSTASADWEWEYSTPYYEDDAWYDVSEWFDGNDYNPTDEEFGEWDDEVYQYDPDEIDVDNDWDYTWDYGYYDTYDDDDFYDYYDRGTYSSYYDYDYDWDLDYDPYDYGWRYYDYDNDGVYDAFASWYDWDDDGFYDDYDYYSFNTTGSEKQVEQAKKNAPTKAKAQRLSGKVEATKKVNVRDGENLVATISKDGKKIHVDLGRANKLDELDLDEGDQITVTGAKTKTGDKTVVVARTVKANGQSVEIDRSRRELEGKVVGLHKTKIRGKQHLIAMVNVDGKQSKVAVDLGPADKLSADIKKGSELEFRAVPVKIGDTKLLMAQAVHKDGQWTQIDRRKKNEG